MAFIWKRLGSTCRSAAGPRPAARRSAPSPALAAPAMEFKSEAIVQPDEVIRYVHPSSAPVLQPPPDGAHVGGPGHRDVTLLAPPRSPERHKPEGAAWVDLRARPRRHRRTFFRADDAARLGVDPPVAAASSTPSTPGAARGALQDGVAFQDNPRTGDCRICGPRRPCWVWRPSPARGGAALLLAHSLAMSAGGSPWSTWGDEVGHSR
ncbi:hypothetical protein QJS66_14785 [Kocuria rhizophila]|nr:hypothetical protein QJS66_14785 [Kocuria rhizophila]